MFSRQSFLAGLLIISMFCFDSSARADSPRNHNDGDGDQIDAAFTLDLAVPSGALDRLMDNLKKLGVRAIGSADGATGSQVRRHIFVGPFSSAEAATKYGDFLFARGVIGGFTVRAPRDSNGLIRIRTIAPTSGLRFSYDTKFIDSSARWPWSNAAGPGTMRPGEPANGAASRSNDTEALRKTDVVPTGAAAGPPILASGDPRASIVALVPAFDSSLIPDPVTTALEDIAGSSAERSGGLWLAGDVGEGVSRLQWIAGPENADLVSVGRDGKVALNQNLLMHYSGADAAGVGAGARFVVLDYIRSHEGLYLLAQMIGAQNRYCLYLSHRIPTAGGEIELQGAINLDNNFDTRINTYRKNGLKLPKECPPNGFDSLVGINPGAHWFNLRVRRIVSDGIIVFHELAEALAKVDFGLDYLPYGLQPGAHDTAVQREIKLQSQRRGSDTVTTLGSNVVFTDWDTFLKFKAEHGINARARER